MVGLAVVKQESAAVAYARVGGLPAVECAWCGRRLGAGDEHRAGRVRCSACGVATTSPWPDDERLAAAYAPWYRPEGGRFSGLGDALLKRTRSTLARRLHRVLPAGPVLDVGAGDGTLVGAFRRQGREATGVDPYAPAPGPHAAGRSCSAGCTAWPGCSPATPTCTTPSAAAPPARPRRALSSGSTRLPRA